MDKYCLEEFCSTFQQFMDGNPSMPEIVDKGGQMLRTLVSRPGWLNDTLTRMVLDDDFIQAQYHSGDPNDIILYRSPSRSFSVRAFIWEPRRQYPIHDHGSWGLVGCYHNQIMEVKYRRIDDGAVKGHAQVEVASQALLSPGESTYVLPLNDGIHRMVVPGQEMSVGIHVYGSPIRKGYFQIFDPHYNCIHRTYSSHNQKRIYAIKTLGTFREEWAEEVLKEARSKATHDFLSMECAIALDKIRR